MTTKILDDFWPEYACKFTPPSFHEVGCPHRRWTVMQLQDALDKSKQTIAYLQHLLFEAKNENPFR